LSRVFSTLNWTPAYALVFTHILGWTQGAEARNLALSLGERVWSFYIFALSLGERAKAQFPSF
jgi:hypothetical protein